MLVENQLVEVSWYSQSKEHYISKGYIFTKYRDKFFVKAEDLCKGSTAYVDVICDYCGDIIRMKWNHYIDILEKNHKCACYKCRHKKRYENNLIKRQNSLYERALEACSKKGYILLTDKSEIKNNVTYIEYLCPIHGVQKMRISNLISGKGCPQCRIDNAREKYKLSKSDIVLRVAECGGNLLNPDDYINRYIKNLKIDCPSCGEPFVTSFVNFTQHGGQLCSNCKRIESLGESEVRRYLEKYNIEFESEKWFDDCRDLKPLPFDFYLPIFNMCIEFDGSQHYYDKGEFSGGIEYVKKHDKIKNDYCKENNIYLIRIPYWKIDKINEILNKELILHKDIV